MTQLKGSIHLLWGGVLFLFGLTACSTPESTVPQVRDMTVSIYAPGRLVDKDAYLLHAPANGILNAWKVKECDSVVAGQLLATVESSNSELNRENARLRMAEIRSKLDKGSSFRQELQLNIDNAKQKYQDDSLNFSRQVRLWEQKIGTQRDFETRKLSMESSKRQYRAVQERRKLQLQQLETELKTSQNLFRISDNQNLDFEVRSKIDGILTETLINDGEWVAPQQPIGRIGGRGDFILELEVDEVDIVKIETGQVAAIALDAYPDKVFEGEVVLVRTQKDPLAQSYRIEVEFRERPKKWFAGMTAEANIVIEEKKQALLIPQSYLFGQNQVITEGGDTLTLKLGETDLEFSEVIEGIDTQTRIVKPGS